MTFFKVYPSARYVYFAQSAVFSTGYAPGTVTLSNSDKTATASSSTEKNVRLTSAVSSGKYYLEFNVGSGLGASADEFVGMIGSTVANTMFPGNTGSGGFGAAAARNFTEYTQIGGTHYGAAYSGMVSNSVGMMAVDMDAKKLWMGKDGIWLYGDPEAGSTYMYGDWTGTPTLSPAWRLYYSGSNITINTSIAYTVPSGFVPFP